MENHNFSWENPLYMAISNSYVKLPEGILFFFHISRLDLYQDVGFFHFMALDLDRCGHGLFDWSMVAPQCIGGHISILLPWPVFIPIRDVISSRMPPQKKENWSTRTRTNSTNEKLTRWRLCLQQKLMQRSATKPVFTCLFLAGPSLFTGGVVPRIISSLIWNFDWPE